MTGLPAPDPTTMSAVLSPSMSRKATRTPSRELALKAKKSKTTEIKGIRLRPGTDEHDISFKVRDAQRFLEEGDKVQVTLIFRSREASHPEIGRAQLQRLAEGTANIAVVEQAPTMEGRRMTMLLAPK